MGVKLLYSQLETIIKTIQMNTISTDFKIQEALDALGVKAINLGTSTGANSFANGA